MALIAQSGHTRFIIASAFFGLLLFLHTEKAFHSHRHHFYTDGQTISVHKGCSICDFQVCKEATVPELSLAITGLKETAVTVNLPVIFFISSLHSVNDERGPPAVAG